MGREIEEIRDGLKLEAGTVTARFPPAAQILLAHERSDRALPKDLFASTLRNLLRQIEIDPHTHEIKPGAEQQSLTVEQAKALRGLFVWAGMSTGNVDRRRAFESILIEAGVCIEGYFEKQKSVETCDEGVASGIPDASVLRRRRGFGCKNG